MSSINIDRERYPDKSDSQIARIVAQKNGYIAVVRYKNNSDATVFTNFGTCQTEDEIHSYLNSPYCHSAEIVYDGRSDALNVTEDLILNGQCHMCRKPASRESLQLMAGNDFYICPECGLMYCDDCYVRLPLTASPGYGTCQDCRVEVHRAIPGFYGKQSGEPAADSVDETPTEIFDISDEGTLHHAIIEQDLAKVQALLRRGDDVEARDGDGATPLHYSADVANPGIMRCLIDAGADVSAVNYKQETPLHGVLSHLDRDNDGAAIKLLVDSGAPLEAGDADGATPLHKAAIAGRAEKTRLLISLGADLEVRAQQLTPLHFAAYAGKADVVAVLIDAGADVAAKKDGMTPLDFAETPNQLASDQGKHEAARLLSRAMASPNPAPEHVSKPAPKPEVKDGDHDWDGGICRICGCSELAVMKFGWQCERIDLAGDDTQTSGPPAKSHRSPIYAILAGILSGAIGAVAVFYLGPAGFVSIFVCYALFVRRAGPVAAVIFLGLAVAISLAYETWFDIAGSFLNGM